MIGQATLVDFLAAGLLTATPLALAALGGCLIERSGVFAIALEGMMLFGCFTAVWGGVVSGSVWVGVCAGLLGGAVAAAIMALATVSLGADQIVAALAVNLVALGATGYGSGELLGDRAAPQSVPDLPVLSVPGLADIPILGPVLFEQSVITYLTIVAIPLAWYVLFRTRWGLSMRAVGEYPRAADSLGVSPWRVRYGALMLCGALAGVGGAVLALQIAGTFTENMTAGRGFIALAAVIFGRWNPIAVGAAALFFGLADALQIRFQVLGLPLSSYFVQMVPYLVALAALVVLGGRSQYAGAIGQAYARLGK